MKNWVLTHADSPRAYAKGKSWGLVEGMGTDGDVWRLYLLTRGGASMHEISRVGEGGLKEGEKAPFQWANDEIGKFVERRESAVWEEKIIGQRKPGEEGINGGRDIPMQTIDPKKERRKKAQALAKKQAAARV